MDEFSTPIMQPVGLDRDDELGFKWWKTWAWIGLIISNLYLFGKLEDNIGLIWFIIAVNTVLMILILQYNKYAFLIATILSFNPILWIINGIYLKNRWNHPLVNNGIDLNKIHAPNIDFTAVQETNTEELFSNTTSSKESVHLLTAASVGEFNTFYKTDLKISIPDYYIAIRLLDDRQVFCLIPKESLEVLHIDGLSPMVRLIDDELIPKYDVNNYENNALMYVSKKITNESDIASLWSFVNQLQEKENTRIKMNNFSGFILGVVTTLILFSYNYQGYSSSYFSFEYSLPMTIFDDWLDMYSETAERSTIASMVLMIFLSWTFREKLGGLISGFIQGFIKKL